MRPMSPALLLLWLAVAPTRPFPDERHLLDRRLEAVRRVLPDGPSPTADAALVRELAERAGLTRVETQARAPVESGATGTVVVELRATGRFHEVDRFFRQLALAPRLPDVESLTLATAPGTLQLTSLVRLPFRPLAAPLTLLPEGARAAVAGVPRPQADAFLRDQALLLDKAQALAAWRRARRNPRLFLSELAAVARERPAALLHAQLADEFVVRGLTVGQGVARQLEARFERGFLRVAEFLMARKGACLQFEVRGRAPVVGPDAQLPMPADDPFAQDEAPCRVERDQGRSLTVKAGGPKGTGPLTLRLRDVDLADVFKVLHVVSGESFVVDGDVAGRATVELVRVSLDEALQALTRGAELRVSGTPPLRRVAVDRKTPLPPLALAGGAPPMTFAVKRGEVRDLLAVMSEADPGLAVLGPPGFLGRSSVFARDAALLDVRAAVLASAGLSERIEDGRRILEHPGGQDEPLPVAARNTEERLVLAPHDVSVAELELAGLASAGGDWTAFAYTPTGGLASYQPGAKLGDGSVRTVSDTDVVVDSEEGPLRVLLAPLR